MKRKEIRGCYNPPVIFEMSLEPESCLALSTMESTHDGFDGEQIEYVW